MAIQVGYLINTMNGESGEPGLFYDFIMARNGLFVRAESHLLKATVLIAPALIRGLAPLEETVELTKGRIPQRLHELAMSILAADRYNERYLAITWEDGYQLRMPWQEGGGAGVSYEPIPNTVLDIHSHGVMGAFFSYTDDRDEQGLKLYMVVGELDTLFPEFELRIGVYGYFAHITFKQVFDV